MKNFDKKLQELKREELIEYINENEEVVNQSTERFLEEVRTNTKYLMMESTDSKKCSNIN